MWLSALLAPRLPFLMPRVETTVAMAGVLAKVPGLRSRVEDVLLAILETAQEARRLQNGFTEMGFEAGHFLRVRVDNHMISYTLDRALTLATVVLVEQIENRPREETRSKAS